MAINIIKEPDINLTQAELEKLQYEYDSFMRGYCGAMSFETFVRNKKALRKQLEREREAKP